MVMAPTMRSLVPWCALLLTSCPGSHANSSTQPSEAAPERAPLPPPASLIKDSELVSESNEDEVGFGSAAMLPMSLEGKIYLLEKGTDRLPDFSTLEPVGRIYTTSLDIPLTNFRKGFPGVTDRFEWFAIDYHGLLNVAKAGTYRFRLLTDDGSKLFIDEKLVIDADGLHMPRKTDVGQIELEAGVHSLRVQYFQGPRAFVALKLEMAEGEAPFEPLDTAKDAVAEVARTSDKTRVTLDSGILFDLDSAKLKPGATRVLERLVGSLEGMKPAPRLVVEGHTDDRGTDEHNAELSDRRARSVVEWLTRHGVAPSRVEARGYGETYPRVPNDSEVNRAKNRRVEVVMLGTPKPRQSAE